MNLISKYKSLIFKLIIGLTIIGIYAYSNGFFINTKFDSQKWKNWTESETEPSLRWDMIKSLKFSYELIGMSKDDILELLGNPNSKTESTFSYYLGYSKNGINTGNLTIKFDENEKVLIFLVNQG